MPRLSANFLNWEQVRMDDWTSRWRKTGSCHHCCGPRSCLYSWLCWSSLSSVSTAYWLGQREIFTVQLAIIERIWLDSIFVSCRRKNRRGLESNRMEIFRSIYYQLPSSNNGTNQHTWTGIIETVTLRSQANNKIICWCNVMYATAAVHLNWRWLGGVNGSEPAESAFEGLHIWFRLIRCSSGRTPKSSWCAIWTRL